MPPNHFNILEDLVGGKTRVKPAHPENSSEPQPWRICAGISWGFLGENLSGPLLDRVWELVSRNPPAIPSKIHERIRRKICRKISRKVLQKIRRKIRQKIRQKICQKLHHWKRAPSSICDRLSVAVSLCHRSCLFCVFNRNQTSTFRCKIHSEIRQKKFALTLCRVSGSRKCLLDFPVFTVFGRIILQNGSAPLISSCFLSLRFAVPNALQPQYPSCK